MPRQRTHHTHAHTHTHDSALTTSARHTPAQKLRSVLSRTMEWNDPSERERAAELAEAAAAAAAAGAGADADADADAEEALPPACAPANLPAVLRAKDCSALRKAHLLWLARTWGYKSDVWRRRGTRARAPVGGNAAAAAAAAAAHAAAPYGGALGVAHGGVCAGLRRASASASAAAAAAASMHMQLQPQHALLPPPWQHSSQFSPDAFPTPMALTHTGNGGNGAEVSAAVPSSADVSLLIDRWLRPEVLACADLLCGVAARDAAAAAAAALPSPPCAKAAAAALPFLSAASFRSVRGAATSTAAFQCRWARAHAALSAWGASLRTQGDGAQAAWLALASHAHQEADSDFEACLSDALAATAESLRAHTAARARARAPPASARGVWDDEFFAAVVKALEAMTKAQTLVAQSKHGSAEAYVAASLRVTELLMTFGSLSVAQLGARAEWMERVAGAAGFPGGVPEPEDSSAEEADVQAEQQQQQQQQAAVEHSGSGVDSASPSVTVP